ncbi:hypothetical protein ACI3PF_19890, partial [Lactococcus lactis]
YLGEKGNSVKVDESKQKTVYDYVVTDSSIEKDFARKAEMDDNVKFYIKLPDWFKIRTPLGPYNPDWALLYEEDDEQNPFQCLNQLQHSHKQSFVYFHQL